MMNNVDQWRNARYLIDAKKDIDTLWFIAANNSKISCDIRRHITRCRDDFYICATTIVDSYVDSQPLSNKQKESFKKDLRNNNTLIDKLKTYRNKRAAHKDKQFCDTVFSSVMDITNECIQIIHEVRKLCTSVLPIILTLNFVCYDAELFRSIYGITKEDEECLRKTKYDTSIMQDSIDSSMPLNIFTDTEDLLLVHNPTDYATILQDGLTLYENIQNRQDWAIKTNVLYNQNIWVEPDEETMRAQLMMIKLGYLDIFGRRLFPIKSGKEYIDDVSLIANAKKYLVYDLHIDEELIKNAIQR